MVQQYVKKSVSDMFIFQVNHHDYVNPCGQALDKRMGGPRSPQWELKTCIQILCHPVYRQLLWFRVGNVITATAVCNDRIFPKAPSLLLLWYRLYTIFTFVIGTAMKRLISVQSSSDYSYLNICDFKATHKQMIFQDLRFSHWCWWRYISARMWCHF